MTQIQVLKRVFAIVPSYVEAMPQAEQAAYVTGLRRGLLFGSALTVVGVGLNIVTKWVAG